MQTEYRKYKASRTAEKTEGRRGKAGSTSITLLSVILGICELNVLYAEFDSVLLRLNGNDEGDERTARHPFYYSCLSTLHSILFGVCSTIWSYVQH